MPPNRSHAKPFTPVKTERSHQENQERAYVAASRRSDRSLEARIESARRASEIHKQRTGRSLRITEAAVLNEEMYEEDDDDLPAHMRRLTAHLRLNQQDADLDRRLGSLLVSQIGMRQALPMTQQPSFYRYSPNGTTAGAYALPQSMHRSLAHTSPLDTKWPGDQSAMHSRNGSVALAGVSPSQVSPLQHLASEQTPTSPSQAQSPGHNRSQSQSQSPHQSQAAPLDSLASTHQPQLPSGGDAGQDTSPFVYGSPLYQDPNSTLFPLSATLPFETQQILAGSHLEFNDPTLGMLMHGSDDYFRNDATAFDEKLQSDANNDVNNDEQFGAFWNDVMLGI